MARPTIQASRVPTPGPWLVRGEAPPDAPPETVMLGVEPATDHHPGGWPYLIRPDWTFAPGDCPLHVAVGIQRLADAQLMAAAPELADRLLRLLTSPELNKQGIAPRIQRERDAAWVLLARVAPHLEIGAWP